MEKASNYIQWKGTDVCIDLYCECGTHHHFDGYFLYAWKCGRCGAIWKMGDEISMTRVDSFDGNLNELGEGE